MDALIRARPSLDRYQPVTSTPVAAQASKEEKRKAKRAKKQQQKAVSGKEEPVKARKSAVEDAAAVKPETPTQAPHKAESSRGKEAKKRRKHHDTPAKTESLPSSMPSSSSKPGKRKREEKSTTKKRKDGKARLLDDDKRGRSMSRHGKKSKHREPSTDSAASQSSSSDSSDDDEQSSSEESSSEEERQRRKRARSRSRARDRARSRSRARSRGRSRSRARYSSSESDDSASDIEEEGQEEAVKPLFVAFTVPGGKTHMRPIKIGTPFEKLVEIAYQVANMSQVIPIDLSYSFNGLTVQLNDKADFQALMEAIPFTKDIIRVRVQKKEPPAKPVPSPQNHGGNGSKGKGQIKGNGNSVRKVPKEESGKQPKGGARGAGAANKTSNGRQSPPNSALTVGEASLSTETSEEEPLAKGQSKIAAGSPVAEQRPIQGETPAKGQPSKKRDSPVFAQASKPLEQPHEGLNSTLAAQTPMDAALAERSEENVKVTDQKDGDQSVIKRKRKRRTKQEMIRDEQIKAEQKTEKEKAAEEAVKAAEEAKAIRRAAKRAERLERAKAAKEDAKRAEAEAKEAGTEAGRRAEADENPRQAEKTAMNVANEKSQEAKAAGPQDVTASKPAKDIRETPAETILPPKQVVEVPDSSTDSQPQRTSQLSLPVPSSPRKQKAGDSACEVCFSKEHDKLHCPVIEAGRESVERRYNELKEKKKRKTKVENFACKILEQWMKTNQFGEEEELRQSQNGTLDRRHYTAEEKAAIDQREDEIEQREMDAAMERERRRLDAARAVEVRSPEARAASSSPSAMRARDSIRDILDKVKRGRAGQNDDQLQERLQRADKAMRAAARRSEVPSSEVDQLEQTQSETQSPALLSPQPLDRGSLAGRASRQSPSTSESELATSPMLMADSETGDPQDLNGDVKEAPLPPPAHAGSPDDGSGKSDRSSDTSDDSNDSHSDVGDSEGEKDDVIEDQSRQSSPARESSEPVSSSSEDTKKKEDEEIEEEDEIESTPVQGGAAGRPSWFAAILGLRGSQESVQPPDQPVLTPADTPADTPPSAQRPSTSTTPAHTPRTLPLAARPRLGGGARLSQLDTSTLRTSFSQPGTPRSANVSPYTTPSGQARGRMDDGSGSDSHSDDDSDSDDDARAALPAGKRAGRPAKKKPRSSLLSRLGNH